MKIPLLVLQIVLIVGFSNSIKAQTYAVKISTPEDERIMGSVEDENSGLYSLIWRGVYNPDINLTTLYFDYRNIIYDINPDGILIDSLVIDTLNGYDLALWNLVKVNDSLLAWGNAYNLENADVHLALLWLDYNLQILDLKLYGNYTDSVQFIESTWVNDKNLVFAGGNMFTSDLILVKTTGNGNFLQEGTFPGMAFPYPNVGYINATDNIICGRYHQLGYINNVDFTIDSIYFPLNFNFISYGYFKPFDDTHCILPGQTVKIPPEYGRTVYCMLIDNVAQMTDSLVFEMQPELNLEVEVDYITPDSLFLGTISNSYSEPPDIGFNHQDRKFALFKFNMHHEIFWEKYYGDHGNYVLLDITATSDGGCILSGTYYDWRNNPVLERDVVIYKVDSEGLLTNLPENNNDGITIFPNPASDNVTIMFSKKQTGNSEKTSIQIYSISGIKTFEAKGVTDNEININVADFPNGIYLFSISLGNDSHFNEKVIVR
jgi:hypothetical protein